MSEPEPHGSVWGSWARALESGAFLAVGLLVAGLAGARWWGTRILVAAIVGAFAHVVFDSVKSAVRRKLSDAGSDGRRGSDQPGTTPEHEPAAKSVEQP